MTITPDLLLELSRYPLFPRTAVDLIRVAGSEAAAALIVAWAGQEWPVPICIGGGNTHGKRRYAQLCEIVGEDAARRIVDQYGGGMLIVPNLKEVRHQRDQDMIRAEFDRLTLRQNYSSRDAVFELGVKYGYAGRTIEKIIKRPDVDLAPVVQGALF